MDNKHNLPHNADTAKQEKQSEIVNLGARVKKEDKVVFQKLGKEHGLTQPELFNKIIDTYLKIESIQEIAQDNKGHAEELRGHLDRIMSIFIELITTSENIRENMKAQFAERIKEKQKRIDELKAKLEQLKADNNSMRETIRHTYERETAYQKEIDGLKKEIDQQRQSIIDKTALIEAKERELHDYKTDIEELKEQREKANEQNSTIKQLTAQVIELDKALTGKTMELENFKIKVGMLEERIKELQADKTEKVNEIVRLREELEEAKKAHNPKG